MNYRAELERDAHGPCYTIFENRHLRLGREEDVSRPHAREVFHELKERGHEVYLWSSGGGAYAAAAADLLGVADLIAGCFGKRREPDVGVDFVVDDDASVVESYGGYRVQPFEGEPWDEKLLKVPEAVGASGPRAAAP